MSNHNMAWQPAIKGSLRVLLQLGLLFALLTLPSYANIPLSKPALKIIYQATILDRLQSKKPAVFSGVGKRMDLLFEHNLLGQLQHELSYQTIRTMLKKRNWPGIKRLGDWLRSASPSPELRGLQGHIVRQLMNIAKKKNKLFSMQDGADNLFNGALLFFYGGQVSLFHLSGVIGLSAVSVTIFPILGVMTCFSPGLFWSGSHHMIYAYYHSELKEIVHSKVLEGGEFDVHLTPVIPDNNKS